MFHRIEKLFLVFLKIFFIFLLGTGIYATYSYLLLISSVHNNILIIIFLLTSYIYILSCYIIIVALFKKYDKLYLYNVFLSPLIPTLFYLTYIIQNKSFSNIFPDNLLALLTIYLFSFIFTIFYLNNVSDSIIRVFVGKRITDFILGDDYSYISIYSKSFPILGDKSLLAANIIENLLNYKLTDYKTISDKGRKYEIYRYTRKYSRKFHPYSENILLLNMECIDINHIKRLDNSEIDDDYPNKSLLINRENIDKNSIDLDDIEILQDISYDCFFINQYYEDGDEISHLPSTGDNEVYLTFANFFSEKDRIIYHKDDDNFISPELWDIRNNLFYQYYHKTYGTLLTKLRLLLHDILDKRAAIISVILILFLIGILYTILKLINTYKLDVIQFTTFLLLIPPALSSILWIYDRLKFRHLKNIPKEKESNVEKNIR